MTRERRRALIIILVTFAVGILIGVLGGGVWNKYHGGGRRPVGWREGGRERFIQKILGVSEADSIQARQLRPLLNQTMARIDSLQHATDREIRAVVDSLGVSFQPILRDEQMKKLKEFHTRGRESRKESH